VISRRQFLATAGASIAGVACSRSPGAGQAGGSAASAVAAPRRVERVGIQLYTLRREMQSDMPGTLDRLAQMGYREVEFAGYFGRTPGQTRELLRRTGLAAPSTHIGYDQVTGNWDRALDDALARGHDYVTIPWLPDDVRGSVDSWRGVARTFNTAARAARSRGLRFAYHNHDFEFIRVGGVVPFDLLLAETDPDLVDFEMDVFWLVKGGGDPLAYFRQHASRFTMLHVKDSSGPPDHRQVNVGSGTIDFGAILRLDATQRHVVRHLFVEHDNPADPLAFARASFDHLSKLEY
jgi:sugar phosphate isomerase/epimerase